MMGEEDDLTTGVFLMEILNVFLDVVQLSQNGLVTNLREFLEGNTCLKFKFRQRLVVGIFVFIHPCQ